MADPYDVYSWDGNSIGPGTDYGALLRVQDPLVVSGSVDMLVRAGLEPQVQRVSRDGRRLRLRLWRATSNITAATFRSNVRRWFDPGKNRSVRYLVLYADDGSTLMRVPAYVESLETVDEGVDQFVVTLTAAQPWFEANSATTSSSNPATVTNAGNVAVRPVIQLTTSTHKTRRACTVTPVSGWPVTAYPVAFALSDAAATSSNVFVFVNGVSVPCRVVGGGGGSSAVWALVNCADDGTPTYVDIFYGSGMTNPLCGMLEPGGLLHSSSGNTSWLNTDWAVLSNPNYCGVWRPDVTGQHHSGASIKYRLAEGSDSVVITLSSFGASDYDSISMRVPAGWDSNANSWGTFSRITANLDGTNAQAYARALYKNSPTWVDLWTTRANASVSTVINGTDGAIALVAGIENDGGVNDPATLTLSNSGTSGSFTRIDLVSSTTPTVSVGAATNVDYYNGTYIVGAYTLTFANMFAPDGTLAIDCLNKTITSSASGPIYNHPTFSDPAVWAALEPGSNTITDVISATDVIVHRDGYG